MNKEIFINESMGETRIAIQENNQLVEVYVEKQDNHRMVGNVYKGKVENVLPGMQAAFVDIGYDLNAFYHFQKLDLMNILLKNVEARRVKIIKILNMIILKLTSRRIKKYMSK